MLPKSSSMCLWFSHSRNTWRRMRFRELNNSKADESHVLRKFWLQCGWSVHNRSEEWQEKLVWTVSMRVRLFLWWLCVWGWECSLLWLTTPKHVIAEKWLVLYLQTIFSLKAFDFEWHSAEVQINKGCFLLWLLKYLLGKLDFKLESAEMWIPVEG